MSQPSLGARLDQLLAILGEIRPGDRIITLTRQVEALKLSLTVDEPPSPRPPTTLKAEDWDVYEAEWVAHVRHQRQRLLEEATLQRLEKQIGELRHVWTEFLQLAALQEPPADAYVEVDDRVRRENQEEHSDGSRGDAEEAGDEQGRTPATEAPLPPKTSHTSGEERRESLAVEDIWNHGKPSDMIITDDSNEYYVLRCRRGKCSSTPKHFGTSPCQGARTHLRKVHGEEMDDGFEYKDANILQLLGIGVKDCTEDHAKQNNAAFKAWYNSKRQTSRRSHHAPPPPSQAPVVKQNCPNKRSRSDDVEGQPPASVLRRAKRLKKPEDIEAGKVYCYEIPGRKCRAAIIVPLFEEWSPGQADVLGTATDLGFFTREANANDPVPQCIVYDKEKEAPKRWVSAYNGAKRHKRVYPALFVEGPRYPHDTKPGWVSAEHLGEYDEFSVDQDRKEHMGVIDYLKKMEEAEARAERRDEQGNPTHITDQLSHLERPTTAQSDPAPDQSNTDTQEAPPELGPHGPAEAPPEPSDAARPEKETNQREEMPGQRDDTKDQEQFEKAHQETQAAYKASLELLSRSLSQPEQTISTPQRVSVPPNSTREGSYSTSEPSTAGELPFTPTRVSQPHRPTATAGSPLRCVAPSDGEFTPRVRDQSGQQEDAIAVLNDLYKASRLRLLASGALGHGLNDEDGNCRDIPGEPPNSSIPPLIDQVTGSGTGKLPSTPKAPIAYMGETSGGETATMPNAGRWPSTNGDITATLPQSFTTPEDSNPKFQLPGPVNSAFSRRNILCRPDDNEF